MVRLATDNILKENFSEKEVLLSAMNSLDAIIRILQLQKLF
jgi:hypothetical protein